MLTSACRYTEAVLNVVRGVMTMVPFLRFQIIQTIRKCRRADACVRQMCPANVFGKSVRQMGKARLGGDAEAGFDCELTISRLFQCVGQRVLGCGWRKRRHTDLSLCVRVAHAPLGQVRDQAA